jgi:hypothetical protein
MIKNILYIHLVLMSFTSAVVGQENLSPSIHKTLVVLEVLNPDDSPYKNAAVKFIDSDMKEYKATTDNNGVLKILLPVGNKFMLHCGDLKNELLINTGRRGYAKWTGTRYTYRFMKFNFNFRDYQNKPVYQESIFTVLDSGDTLTEKTNQDGNADFFVPIESAFEVSTKYKIIKNFESPDGEYDGHEAISLSFRYRGQSSKAIEQEEKEDQLAQIEFEKQQKTRDSIRAYEDSIRSTQPTHIIFFASNAVKSSDIEMGHLGEISVFDGGKEGNKIGTVKAVWTCHSGPGEKHAEVILEKTKGTYSYYAKSSQGYEWEGDYEITGGGWKQIILEISEGKKVIN